MTLDVYDLLKTYGDTVALDVPSLHVEAGTAFGLVGSNGAGKTTFLRCLLDLLRPDRGRICLDGQDVARHSEWKAETGSYLDDSFLIPFLTPDEFFAFSGAVFGLTPEATERALGPYRPFFTDELLGETTKYIRELSMGNKKKVGIMAAMMTQPRLLVLDEPFANLDPGSQIRLKHYLRQLNSACGTTLLISSHDLGHVTDVCKRIALLEDGRLVRDIETSDATLRELEHYFSSEA